MRFTTPAAVIGTLAAVLTAAPADADERVRAMPDAGHAATALSPLTAAPLTQRSTSAAHLPSTAQPSTARQTTYTIKPGDTVSSIAARHGLPTADVLALNGLGWRSVIYPGQKLRLSAKAQPAAPKPAPKATAAKPAPKPAAPAATHTVVRGDTVYAIAAKYRTTVASIIAANGLGSSAIIYPGQKLRVGAASAKPAAKPAPQHAPKPAPAPAAKPKAHTVALGDTLFSIAQRYDITVAVLLSANGLASGSIIYPGQALLLAPPVLAQRSATLDTAQRAHAVHIINVGRELGVPDHGIAIALATAMVESSMRNLDYGDRDSLGLFQQRPSQGWGTAAQILDADRSIRVFYGGPKDPNGANSRGLLDISGWQSRTFTAAAQAVQISAYPDRYGQWETQAHQWVATLR
ncbi:putative secreted protein [Microbacterium esteraromaticum]|uniref:Putative secreted protein n=2 Tax=Microbacterium esteraromaticum TaxID=57043 RepID=A0A1R4IJN1_9MICO|nr:putative secreted protein [Microbacterium esteraromaticum]